VLLKQCKDAKQLPGHGEIGQEMRTFMDAEWIHEGRRNLLAWKIRKHSDEMSKNAVRFCERYK
jgi:hypothetical protein